MFVFGQFLQAAFAVENFPELVHDVNESAAVDKLFHTVDEVTDNRIANLGVFDNVGVVKADDVSVGKVDAVFGVVEYPAEAVAAGPFADVGV